MSLDWFDLSHDEHAPTRVATPRLRLSTDAKDELDEAVDALDRARCSVYADLGAELIREALQHAEHALVIAEAT